MNPNTKQNPGPRLSESQTKNAPKVALYRRHTSPFPEGEDEVDKSPIIRWSSSPFSSGEVRFHKTEDSSLESNHVIDYLQQATSEEAKALLQSPGGSAVIEDLSCEETICDESIKSIEDILKKNHRTILLKTLRLPRNNLSSAAAASLANILSVTNTLMHLDIRHNQIQSIGLAKLIQPLTEHGGEKCSLITLNVMDNRLTRKAASHLADLLRKNKTLEEVHLGENPLSAKGMKDIMNGLNANADSKVRHLDLKATGMGGKGAGLKALIELLRKNERMQSLDLSKNSLRASGAIEFASVFWYKNNLQELILSGNDIGAKGVSAIANALQEDGVLANHCHLKRLTLDYNQLGDEGAKFLAVCLEKNSTLQYLDISNNKVGSAGAAHLANTFGFNFCLQEVVISDNDIDDQGAFALASVLATKHCSIQMVDWENNSMSDEGNFFLNHVFQFRESLKTWLGHLQKDVENDRTMCVNWWRTENVITDWEVASLAQSVAEHKPRMLQSIWLAGKRVTGQSLDILFLEYLAKNPALQRLYLKEVTLNESFSSLQRALKTNSTMRILSVTGCKLSAADAANLALALKHNSALERLNLQGNEIGDEGFRFLWNVINPSNGVAPHQSLVALLVGNHNLSDVSMSTLRDSGSMGKLEELHLDRNLVTDRGALDLAQAIMDSATLKVLSVGHNDQMTYRGKNTLRMFAPDRFSC